MPTPTPKPPAPPSASFNPFDLVALLDDRPADGLARGQVGSIVLVRDDATPLVCFRDGSGKCIAEVHVPPSALLQLRYAPVTPP